MIDDNYCIVLLDRVTVLLEYIVCFHSWCTIIVWLYSVVCFIIVVKCSPMTTVLYVIT